MFGSLHDGWRKGLALFAGTSVSLSGLGLVSDGVMVIPEGGVETVTADLSVSVLTNGGGRLVVDAGAGLQVTGEATVSGRSSFELAGSLKLGESDDPSAAGSASVCFDKTLWLKDAVAEFPNLATRGKIRSADEKICSELDVGADNRDGRVPAGLPQESVFGKIGTGEYLVTAPLPRGVVVKKGTLNLPGAGAEYPNYRFKVESVYGSRSTSSEVGEIKFLDGADDVTRPYAAVARSSRSTIADWQGVAKAFDGVVYNNRWNEPNAGMIDARADRDDAWAQISYDAPKRITAYLWATGVSNPYYNDTHQYPTGWRLQGSSDGTSWTDIDAVAYVKSTCASSTWVNASVPFKCGPYAGDSTVVVEKGAQLKVGGDQSFASLVNCGTLAIADSAELEMVSAAGETSHLVGGGISGTAGVRIVGDGVVEMSGSNSYSGDTKVESGTLKLVSSAAPQFLRFVIRQVNGGKECCLSEIKLFASDGSRVGVGMTLATAGTRVSTLAAGSVCQERTYPETWVAQDPSLLFNDLIDEKTDTTARWRLSMPCLTNGCPRANWVVVAMRLPAGSKPVASYNFTTPNPTYWNQYRPSSWQVEASYDGEVWFAVDDRTGVSSPNTAGLDYTAGPFALAMPAEGGAPLPDASRVSVAQGATLDLSDSSQTIAKLSVDMNGAGTIIGFSPAAQGSLDLTNAPSDLTGALPITLVGPAENVGLVRTWSVCVDGVRTGHKLRWRNGNLEIGSDGLMLLLR